MIGDYESAMKSVSIYYRMLEQGYFKDAKYKPARFREKKKNQ